MQAMHIQKVHTKSESSDQNAPFSWVPSPHPGRGHPNFFPTRFVSGSSRVRCLPDSASKCDVTPVDYAAKEGTMEINFLAKFCKSTLLNIVLDVGISCRFFASFKDFWFFWGCRHYLLASNSRVCPWRWWLKLAFCIKKCQGMIWSQEVMTQPTLGRSFMFSILAVRAPWNGRIQGRSRAKKNST